MSTIWDVCGDSGDSGAVRMWIINGVFSFMIDKEEFQSLCKKPSSEVISIQNEIKPFLLCSMKCWL